MHATGMDRYVRVEQSREPQPAIDENEVRIMSGGKLHSYVAYATTLLTVRASFIAAFFASFWLPTIVATGKGPFLCVTQGHGGCNQ